MINNPKDKLCLSNYLKNKAVWNILHIRSNTQPLKDFCTMKCRCITKWRRQVLKMNGVKMRIKKEELFIDKLMSVFSGISWDLSSYSLKSLNLNQDPSFVSPELLKTTYSITQRCLYDSLTRRRARKYQLPPHWTVLRRGAGVWSKWVATCLWRRSTWT